MSNSFARVIHKSTLQKKWSFAKPKKVHFQPSMLFWYVIPRRIFMKQLGRKGKKVILSALTWKTFCLNFLFFAKQTFCLIMQELSG